MDFVYVDLNLRLELDLFLIHRLILSEDLIYSISLNLSRLQKKEERCLCFPKENRQIKNHRFGVKFKSAHWHYEISRSINHKSENYLMNID